MGDEWRVFGMHRARKIQGVPHRLARVVRTIGLTALPRAELSVALLVKRVHVQRFPLRDGFLCPVEEQLPARLVVVLDEAAPLLAYSEE